MFVSVKSHHKKMTNEVSLLVQGGKSLFGTPQIAYQRGWDQVAPVLHVQFFATAHPESSGCSLK